MIGTANMTEEAVREAGITAPLMIMRGDGGVMDVQEMRRRPVVTMLSGPAASVAGALMYLRISDGIYFEVGGTSTNIGVIRNGRPTIKHARVGGHDTYVNSLDVRVIGIAGGSMVRVRGNDIHDVGPRSAHIAGLHYAAFAKPEDIVDPRIELFRPKDGDPDDYLAIRCSNGERYALTNTCAANILGYAKPGWHAHGNAESARRAFAPLAQRIGSTIEEAARRVLVKAAAKVTGVVEDLVGEYKLDRDQAVLVGEGGGAASLIPFVAEIMKLDFKISQDAEVISSIGVALALVRETIERVIPNPGPEDLQRIKREAFDAVVKLGAAPENVEVVDRGRSADATRARHRHGRFGNARAGHAQAGERGRSGRHCRNVDGPDDRDSQAGRGYRRSARVPGRGDGTQVARFHHAPHAGTRRGSRRRNPHPAQRWRGHAGQRV